MPQTTQHVFLQLSSAGTNTGPFDISDSLSNIISLNVPKATLLTGNTYSVNVNATYVVIQSNGICNNSINIYLPSLTTTTTTTTTIPQEFDLVYLTNMGSGAGSAGRGVKVFFSQNNYYNPPLPASLITANCLSTTDLGASPFISITVEFWRDDVSNTIDNGSGGYRSSDGSKTININTNGLTYNGSNGCWQRNVNDVFTISEGLNIAAFKITSMTSAFYFNGINHNLQLTPSNSFIRVKSGFLVGSTPAIFLDLF